jgi:hypothetical protein
MHLILCDWKLSSNSLHTILRLINLLFSACYWRSCSKSALLCSIYCVGETQMTKACWGKPANSTVFGICTNVYQNLCRLSLAIDKRNSGNLQSLQDFSKIGEIFWNLKIFRPSLQTLRHKPICSLNRNLRTEISLLRDGWLPAALLWYQERRSVTKVLSDRAFRWMAKCSLHYCLTVLLQAICR